MPNRIFFADNLPVLQSLPTESIDLIYIDPPFITGRVQAQQQILASDSLSTKSIILILLSCF